MNYYAIYGTGMGETVKANSQLADEFHHILIQKSANLMREVTVPRDLEMMRGYDGKTTKTNMTDEFSFEFGASGEFISHLDTAAKDLYEALGGKSRKIDESQKHDLLNEISTYFENCLLLDDKIIWDFVENKKKEEQEPVNSEGSLIDQLQIYDLNQIQKQNT